MILSASCVSPSPVANPLARRLRTKPASRPRAVTPIGVMEAASMSRHPPQQAVADFAGHAALILIGLEQADQRVMHSLGILMKILDAETGQGSGPIQGFGDTGHLAQIFLPDRRHHTGDLQR